MSDYITHASLGALPLWWYALAVVVSVIFCFTPWGRVVLSVVEQIMHHARVLVVYHWQSIAVGVGMILLAITAVYYGA